MGINRKLTLVAPDIHFPEHDPVALELFTKVVSIMRPWRVVQLGDILDCIPFSRHPLHKIREAKDYDWKGQELEPARKFIAKLLKYTSYYHQLLGNHEERAESWCIGAGLAGEALWSIIDPRRSLLGGFERSQVGLTPYISDGDVTSHYRLTKGLIAVHGWSFARHAAAVHLAKSAPGQWSVIYGHTHRIQQDTMRNPRTDDYLKAWSPGCLRTLRPKYTQSKGPTGWAQGFSPIYVGRSSWTAYIVEIAKGRCVLPDGREIRI